MKWLCHFYYQPLKEDNSMKRSLHTRILALIMAIAIVLSTGVLNSAGWLLASGGDDTGETTETTSAASTQQSQGGTTVKTATVATTPDSATATDPSGTTTATDPSGTTDPSETTASTAPSETSEPQTSVKLTVVLRAVYSDGKASHTIAYEDLVFSGDETSKTFVAGIPAVEGYTFTVNMTLRADGKYEKVLSRPDADRTETIDVYYTAAEPDPTGESTEATEPATEATDPAQEGTVTLTVNVYFTDQGGVLEPS